MRPLGCSGAVLVAQIARSVEQDRSSARDDRRSQRARSTSVVVWEIVPEFDEHDGGKHDEEQPVLIFARGPVRAVPEHPAAGNESGA